MADAGFRVGALLLPDDADRAPAKPADAAHDGLVVREGAIARQRREIGDQPGEIIAEMRALLVPGDLRLLPGGQRQIEVGERLLRLDFEPGQLLANGDALAAARQGAQLLDLGLELGDGFFKIEISANGHGSRGANGPDMRAGPA